DARDQPDLHRIVADAEDDRDGRGRGFGGARSRRVARYRNYPNLTADQLGRQLRHPLILPLRPAVFDRDVLTFHETGFVETFAECGHVERPDVDRTGTEKSDHR